MIFETTHSNQSEKIKRAYCTFRNHLVIGFSKEANKLSLKIEFDNLDTDNIQQTTLRFSNESPLHGEESADRVGFQATLIERKSVRHSIDRYRTILLYDLKAARIEAGWPLNPGAIFQMERKISGK